MERERKIQSIAIILSSLFILSIVVQFHNDRQSWDQIFKVIQNKMNGREAYYAIVDYKSGRPLQKNYTCEEPYYKDIAYCVDLRERIKRDDSPLKK